MEENFRKEDLRRFNEEIFASMPDEPYLGPVPAGHVSRRKVSSVDMCFRAASIILAVALLWMAGRSFIRPEENLMAFTPRSADVYTVANGVRSCVTLPDSSVIWLNCGSELRVSDGFDNGERSVYLEGEGYFEVKSDPDHPFYVHTPAGPVVKVTGTEFNLSCYASGSGMKVTLLRGAVEILTWKDEVIPLEEGSKITLKGDFSSMDDNPDIDGDTAWTRGTLHFDNTPMRDVIEAIERWYGVEVTVRDSSVYRNCFTEDFRAESVNQDLELLAITCGLVYTVDGTRIVIG